MSKNLSVAFISDKLRRQFDALASGNDADKRLHAFLSRALDDLKANPACGTKIAKRLWPREYMKRYRITNLWKYDLPGAWRVIYTIDENDVRVMSVVLEWFNHKGYDRRFKY